MASWINVAPPSALTGLLYGAGLRQIECLSLRVKDIDFAYRQVLVRDGKGQKDRVTMLPQSLMFGHSEVSTTMV